MAGMRSLRVRQRHPRARGRPARIHHQVDWGSAWAAMIGLATCGCHTGEALAHPGRHPTYPEASRAGLPMCPPRTTPPFARMNEETLT